MSSSGNSQSSGTVICSVGRSVHSHTRGPRRVSRLPGSARPREPAHLFPDARGRDDAGKLAERELGRAQVERPLVGRLDTLELQARGRAGDRQCVTLAGVAVAVPLADVQRAEAVDQARNRTPVRQFAGRLVEGGDRLADAGVVAAADLLSAEIEREVEPRGRREAREQRRRVGRERLLYVQRRLQRRLRGRRLDEPPPPLRATLGERLGGGGPLGRLLQRLDHAGELHAQVALGLELAGPRRPRWPDPGRAQELPRGVRDLRGGGRRAGVGEVGAGEALEVR